jgi:hypothetical protein
MHPATTRMHEKLQEIKAKPEHVRQNIALGVSGGITLIVFAGWLGALSHNHTFALDSSVPKEVTAPNEKLAETKSNFSSLLGAAGAAFGATTSPSEIKIIDSAPKTEQQTPSEQTVIHF